MNIFPCFHCGTMKNDIFPKCSNLKCKGDTCIVHYTGTFSCGGCHTMEVFQSKVEPELRKCLDFTGSFEEFLKEIGAY